MYKIDYIVRIRKYPKNHINSEARVVSVDRVTRKVKVSNLNMPFCGSLCNSEFKFSEIEKC